MRIITLILCLCLAPAVHAQEILRDIRYGATSIQELDVFVAPKPDAPIAVLIHGGAWFGGRKEDLDSLAIYLQALGYTAASIDYRLSWQGTFPSNIEDVSCALAFLKSNAALFNADPDRVAILGYSSGGHLAALQALVGSRYLTCVTNSDLSIDALIGVSGIYSFDHTVRGEPDRLMQMIGDSALYWQAAEPISQLDGLTDVRILLLTAATDHIVPPINTYTFYDSLVERGADVRLDTFFAKDHVTMLSNVSDGDSVVTAIRTFLGELWPAGSEGVDHTAYDLDIRFVDQTVIVQANVAGTMVINDLLGREVARFAIDKGLSSHRVWNVSHGLYLVTIQTSEGTATVRVILE